MLLVFLEFSGHGELCFKNLVKSFTHLLRYLCLVFYHFFGTPYKFLEFVQHIVLQLKRISLGRDSAGVLVIILSSSGKTGFNFEN